MINRHPYRLFWRGVHLLVNGIAWKHAPKSAGDKHWLWRINYFAANRYVPWLMEKRRKKNG